LLIWNLKKLEPFLVRTLIAWRDIEAINKKNIFTRPYFFKTCALVLAATVQPIPFKVAVFFLCVSVRPFVLKYFSALENCLLLIGITVVGSPRSGERAPSAVMTDHNEWYSSRKVLKKLKRLPTKTFITSFGLKEWVVKM